MWQSQTHVEVMDELLALRILHGRYLQHIRYTHTITAAAAVAAVQSYEIMDELVALRILRGDFDSLIGGAETAAFKEGRKSEMLDSMIRNMRDSGRLLGAF